MQYPLKTKAAIATCSASRANIDKNILFLRLRWKQAQSGGGEIGLPPSKGDRNFRRQLHRSPVRQLLLAASPTIQPGALVQLASLSGDGRSPRCMRQHKLRIVYELYMFSDWEVSRLTGLTLALALAALRLRACKRASYLARCCFLEVCSIRVFRALPRLL
jgi:hypothetical protein